jgi:hypothetical protein
MINSRRRDPVPIERLWIERKEVLALGDSHAGVFSSTHMAAAFPDHRFTVVAVAGATVSGLPNPNTRTQTTRRFRAALKKSAARMAIVMLGEVDTGFVIWRRAEKYASPVEDMLQLALKSYQDLLLLVSGKFQAVCVSAPLPTIRDGANWGTVANARKDVTATQLERTALTCAFNQSMNGFCDSRSIPYLMLDPCSMGEDGLVKDALLNSDPNNHHYDATAHARLIEPLLRPLLDMDIHS